MRTFLLLLALAVAAPAAWAADEKPATSTVTPQAGNRQARIAGGQTVTVAASSKTAAQWAELRPNYRALVPQRH